jgi:hypothetical protein
MKHLSRHTVVVLLVALLSSAGGLTLAVVAFGQGDASLSPYATTPTTTTPTTTTPTTTTPSTTPGSTTPASTTPASTVPTKTSTTPSEATTTNGANPERKHGTTVPLNNGGGPPPSQATRKGPSHLAFTGGEPIYIGFFGAALIVGGLMLHRRRRTATDR